MSTLPIFGKIFEKIIYSRLYKFLTQKGMISDSQFGFRKNHSTGHAIHHSVNIIKKGLQSKKHVLGILVHRIGILTKKKHGRKQFIAYICSLDDSEPIWTGSYFSNLRHFF